MAAETYIPPSKRLEDLAEFKDVEDVPVRIRELPRYFFLKESDFGLKETLASYVRNLKSDSEVERKEAKDILSKVQLTLLNLMLKCSGYKGETIMAPVTEWPTEMLIGDARNPRNFGNPFQPSRPSDDSRYDDPNNGGEGWLYRVLDFKDNFGVVISSLRYFEPDDEQHPKMVKKRQSEQCKFALNLIASLFRGRKAEPAKAEPTKE
jgi:hypothetical protein